MDSTSAAAMVVGTPADWEQFNQRLNVSQVRSFGGARGSQVEPVGECDGSFPQATNGEPEHNSPPAYMEDHRLSWIKYRQTLSVPVSFKDEQMTLSARQDWRGLDKSISVSATSLADPTQPPFRFAGICASLLASVFFSFSILIVKMLPESGEFGDYAQLLFFRGPIIMLLCSIHILYTGETFLVCRQEVLVNLLRALFGTIYTFGSYCALNYISAGDSTAIVFSAPIWTSILSYFILGEPFHWVHFVGLPASLFGIVLIAHPTLIVPAEYLWTLDAPKSFQTDEGLSEPFDLEQRWLGVALSFLTSVALASCFIVLKFRKRTSIPTTTFWFASLSCLTGALFMYFFGAGRLPSTSYEWQLIIANGIFGWLGQSTLQWAFTYEQAGLLSIVRTADVAITFALSAIFLDDAIYWTSIMGAAIISAVVVLIVLNNWVKALACCQLLVGRARARRQPSVYVSSADSKLSIQLPLET